jgi:hypothetical protein
MKKLKVFTIVVVCFIFVSVQAGAVGFRTGFNNYQITEVNNLDIAKSVDKVWNLTYEGSQNPITVMKRHTGESTVYIVSSEFFEVCYASTSKGFGTRTVKKAWSSVPGQINGAVINAEELKKQQILTPQKVDDEKALGLIASYLPNLLNEEYTHLLN